LNCCRRRADAPTLQVLQRNNGVGVDPSFIIGGALVGFIVGVTGVGGGSLMTPLLTLAFGVAPNVAVGTDLLFAAITKSGGAAAHARRRNVNWPIVGWLVAGSAPAAALTLGLLDAFAPDPTLLATLIRPLLGVALLLTAAALVLQRQIAAAGQRFARRERPRLGAPATLGAATGTVVLPLAAEGLARPLPTLLIGSVIGSLVAITSVGAGVLGVVALSFLYPLLPMRQVVGVDIAHAVPLTLVAGLGHWWIGNVDWILLGTLLIGSLPAIHLGAAVAHRLPERALRLSLAMLLLAIGGRLVMG
jgi:uncharacterized membrane protein YfcA